MGRLSFATRLYITAVVAAAAGILYLVHVHVPDDLDRVPHPAFKHLYQAPPQVLVQDAERGFWVVCIGLALLFLICDSTPTVLGNRQWAWSPSSAATLAAVVLLGSDGKYGAAMVGAIAIFSIRRHVPLVERLFNGAMYAIAGYAAGVTFQQLDGTGLVPLAWFYPVLHPQLPVGEQLFVSVQANFEKALVPFAAAAVVHMLVNHGLLWGMLLFDRRNRTIPQEAGPSWSTPLLVFSDLGFAALGLVIAALWVIFGPLAAAIVLVTLYVARWAMAQFAAQQYAHTATLRALCQAVETKDFYTRGHSERVSRGSGMIARQIGMRSDRAEAVRFAGMLHDVGKLGVPTRVLQKQGRLTEEEYAAIQLHPMRGLEIVKDIGFLHEALNGIMHHHERIDGRGYPMGFADDEIPEFARIIAVADAFDSMTSTRAYRGATSIPEAIAELRRGAGTQFDPKIVEAFITALSQDQWKPQEPSQPRGHQIVTSQDHDDPMAPLRVVERQ
ncbi:MAG: HD-GYP domain-containing protein [Streptosporangiaceae bacterium]